MHAVVSAFEIALAMNAPPPPPGAPALPPARCARRSPAVTAGVTLALAALGAAAYLAMRPGRSASQPSTAAQLDASAAAVAARHPEMKLDLAPLTAAELSALTAPVWPCGAFLLEPVGATATDRPTVRWLAIDGATEYQVTIEGPGAALPIHATTKDLAYPWPARVDPPAVGSTYTVVVRAEVGAKPGDAPFARSEFTVLPAGKRASWRSLVGDVESNEPASVRDLLIAHAALRRGLFAEALRRTDAASLARPHEPAARPLLTALARVFQLGSAPPPWAGFASR